jgi:AmiR/NasT family two-component response regulator
VDDSSASAPSDSIANSATRAAGGPALAAAVSEGLEPRVAVLEREYGHLRVLVANQLAERAQLVSEIARSLGHEVVALELNVDHVAERTRTEHPDVALVGLGESSQHALELIEQIVRSAACPVILLLDAKDPDFVNEAAKRGVFAYLVNGDPNELQAALDIALRRFAEYHNLEGAFGRRATIERAKGILMAIHGIDEQQAFELLRNHSQRDGHKLVDVAEAVTQTHRLTTPNPTDTPKQ